MRFPVTDQSGFLREGFAANVTNVRPDAGVNEQVLFERGPSGEGFVADLAIVGSVPGVDSHVDLEARVSGESFAAFLADDALAFLVLPEHVLVEIFLANHAAFAHVTLVFSFVVSELLMDVEGVAVEASFATNVANNRLLAVAEPHVVRQVSLDLELLGADIAREFEVVGVFSCDMHFELVFVFVFVVALAAGEKFGSLVRRVARRLVFSFYMRIKRRFLLGLEVALVAEVNLVLWLHRVLSALVRAQRPLVPRFEAAAVAAVNGPTLRLIVPSKAQLSAVVLQFYFRVLDPRRLASMFFVLMGPQRAPFFAAEIARIAKKRFLALCLGRLLARVTLRVTHFVLEPRRLRDYDDVVVARQMRRQCRSSLANKITEIANVQSRRISHFQNFKILPFRFFFALEIKQLRLFRR